MADILGRHAARSPSMETIAEFEGTLEMRGLTLVVLATLLVSCGGSSGDGAAEHSATPRVDSATAPTAVGTLTATATDVSMGRLVSPVVTAPATPSAPPTLLPTATEVLPTPVVVGSPAANLPIVGQVTATIPVGVSPLAVVAGHGAIWVQNDVDGTISRIDPTTNSVVASIPIATPLDLSRPPSDLLGLRQARPALAVDATSVWATKPEEYAVVQIDPKTNTVIATIPMNAKVTGIASDGSSLWVSLFGTSQVLRINPVTHEVIATIADVPTPAGIAVHQHDVWVTNYLSDTVTRIDRTTNQIVEQIAVRWPGAPFTGYQCSLCATEVLATANGVWVTLLTAGVVARIDPATSRLAAIIPVGVQPTTLASDARGVWVGHKSTAGVLLINPDTNQVVAAVPAADAPHQLPTLAVSENTLWVARGPAHDVVRIDLHRE